MKTITKMLIPLFLVVCVAVAAAPAENQGVQVQEYVYDFAVDGGATGEIVLSNKSGYSAIPVGAIITKVTMKVVTAFTSGGSATLDWGNGDDADGYNGTTVAVAALVDNFIVTGWDSDAVLLWDSTNFDPIYVNVSTADDGEFNITIITADMTAGKAIFLVEYYYPSLK